MINSYMKLRVERAIEEIYTALRVRVLNTPTMADTLKLNQSVYIPINDLPNNWIATVGLSDPEHLANQRYGSYSEHFYEIIMRHMTNQDLFVDIVLKVEIVNGQRIVAHNPRAQSHNLPSHIDYEDLMRVLNDMLTRIPNLDFNTATVIFSKTQPPSTP